MPLDSEPRDGDYASYIDALVNQHGTAPGQTGRRSRVGGVRIRSRFPGMPSSPPTQSAPLPASDGSSPPPPSSPALHTATTAPMAAQQVPDTPQPTLADLAARRRGGLVMMVIGIAALLKGLDFAANVVLYQQFSELIPMFVLLLIGNHFLQYGRGLRRKGKLPG